MLCSKALIISSVVFITGCSCQALQKENDLLRTQKDIVQTKLEAVSIPESFFVTCKVEQPPNKKLYLSSTHEQKESLLINYSKRQLIELRKCNEVITKIKEQNNIQKEIIESNK